jgi:hypothetical protein
MQKPFAPGHRILIACLFTIATLALFPYLQYGFNPDAVAYLRIASYYQKGEWRQALNDYWSPLISWILWPFYAIGLPWLYAFRLVNFLAALLSLFKLGQIIDRRLTDLSAFTRIALLLTFSAQLLFLEYTTVTPDLLTLCLLIYLAERYLSDKLLTHPLYTGLLGALLFFSKSYCFYFFLAFIGLYTIHRIWYGRFRQFPPKAFVWLFLGFALPSGIWMKVNHAKYGAWQVSASAAYNYNNLDSGGIIRHPYNSTHKLIALPYSGAFCLWEDPQLTYHYSMKEGLSHRPLKWYWMVIGTNTGNLWAFLKQSGIGWWIFLPLICWPLSRLRRSPLYTGAYLRLAFFTTLYVSGYMLILVVGRYVWLLLFVLWLFLYKAIEWLAIKWLTPVRHKQEESDSGHSLPAKASIFLLTCYCLYAILSPLPNYFHYGLADHQSEKTIAAAIPPGSHIASWHSRDLWTPFCQYDVHDYGGIASYTGWQELKADLKTFGIQYLILTDTSYIKQVPAETATHMNPVCRSGTWTLYSFSL